MKPCPFCNSKDLQIIQPSPGENVWWYHRVWCRNCQTYGPTASIASSSEEDAIRFWNNRIGEM